MQGTFIHSSSNEELAYGNGHGLDWDDIKDLAWFSRRYLVNLQVHENDVMFSSILFLLYHIIYPCNDSMDLTLPTLSFVAS